MSKSELKRLCTQDPIRMAEQLEAAKQRELELRQQLKYERENPSFAGRLDSWQAVAGKYRQENIELLAVIEKMNVFVQHKMHCEMLDPFEHTCSCTCGLDAAISTKPSKALREHEAKVLEEAADYFDSLDSMPEFERIKQAYVTSLRRMAEELRKK